VFDVGFNELVLIFIIGLLVLGPQRLPKVAAEIGKWIGRARRTATELRRQLEREIELNDIQPPPPPSSPTDTQNPFHHAPMDTGAAPPSADAASEAPIAPPATAVEPAPAAPTPETATASASAKAPEPVSAPAPEAAKAPEPTDRPPHV
jgi:sec-independent protein translocase protein TatB